MINVIKTDLNEILPLRSLFLKENNFQIRYNACHERGWTDSYVVMYENKRIGYAAIKGNQDLNDRDTVFEFYIVRAFRKLSSASFLELLRSSTPRFIECQSNEFLLTSLLFEYGQNISSNVILFEDSFISDLKIDNVIFRKRNGVDVVFEHKAEPVGDYVLELNKQVVATGGFMLHYNAPFADLYMEVKEDFRKKGLGSFLIQEVKKQCYLAGRVPAARTGIENVASKATLMKAGLKIAGFMLLGRVAFVS
jgi:GNAT superfamily N-acetyltransferase